MITSDRRHWTLERVLQRRAEEHPDRPYIEVIDEGAETFGQVHAAALKVAAGLQTLGVRKGSALVIMTPNCLNAVHTWLAASFIGGIEVTINTAYRAQLLEHALNTVAAEVMVIEDRFLTVLKESEGKLPHLKKAVHFRLFGSPAPNDLPSFERIELVDFDSMLADAAELRPAAVDYYDIASVIYTSGTTGPAKGVMMPQAQVYHLAEQTIRGLRLTSDDIYYCFHPLFHMAGKFMALYAMLMVGGRIVLDRSFHPELWVDRIRHHRATVGLAHGPMVEMIYAQPERAEDADNVMERILSAPFPRRIAQAFERRFGIRGIEVWGMTEINVPCWRPYDEPLRPGSCGKIDPDAVEFRIADPETDEELPAGQVGEFLLRPKSPWTIMQGYAGMAEKTVQAWRNLWFHTGDSGYVDAEGYVYFVDRLGDRIRRRAENISSYDIESAAATHSDVAECAAVGVPSEFESDDDIKLCVVLRPGRCVAPMDLIRYLAGRLPHYMVPRYLEFMDQLPRTPTNKVKRAELRLGGTNTWDRKSTGVSLREIADTARQVS
jgi:crotonobetaine/carnitine-CoA ligase